MAGSWAGYVQALTGKDCQEEDHGFERVILHLNGNKNYISKLISINLAYR